MLKLVIGNKNYSSWSLRPWLVLKQFGIEFEEVRIPLDENFSSRITEYSPAGKVPVLIDQHRVVWESLSICEYLAEKFHGQNLWPLNAEARAAARSVSHEMHAGFQALRQSMPMNCRASAPGKGMGAGVQDDISRLVSIWKEMRTTYGGEGLFLFGSFTIADAMFAPIVLRFKTYGVKTEPVSTAYREAVLASPALNLWLNAAAQEKEVISDYEL